jgi:hypothetical protein
MRTTSDENKNFNDFIANKYPTTKKNLLLKKYLGIKIKKDKEKIIIIKK